MVEAGLHLWLLHLLSDQVGMQRWSKKKVLRLSSYTAAEKDRLDRRDLLIRLSIRSERLFLSCLLSFLIPLMLSIGKLKIMIEPGNHMRLFLIELCVPILHVELGLNELPSASDNWLLDRLLPEQAPVLDLSVV